MAQIFCPSGFAKLFQPLNDKQGKIHVHVESPLLYEGEVLPQVWVNGFCPRGEGGFLHVNKSCHMLTVTLFVLYFCLES